MMKIEQKEREKKKSKNEGERIGILFICVRLGDPNQSCASLVPRTAAAAASYG